jgi:hypothetical protein
VTKVWLFVLKLDEVCVRKNKEAVASEGRKSEHVDRLFCCKNQIINGLNILKKQNLTMLFHNWLIKGSFYFKKNAISEFLIKNIPIWVNVELV